MPCIKVKSLWFGYDYWALQNFFEELIGSEKLRDCENFQQEISVIWVCHAFVCFRWCFRWAHAPWNAAIIWTVSQAMHVIVASAVWSRDWYYFRMWRPAQSLISDTISRNLTSENGLVNVGNVHILERVWTVWTLCVSDLLFFFSLRRCCCAVGTPIFDL